MTGHYTKDANGQVYVQIYDSPVGVAGDPASDQWRFRHPALVPAPNGGARAQDATYTLSLAGNTPQANIQAEDGVPLLVALTGVNGQAAQPVAGALSSDAETYAAFANAGISAAFRPTVSGVDLRLTFTRPTSTGTVSLYLRTGASQQSTTLYPSTDPGGQALLAQQADGTIAVQRHLQVCGSQGCQTITAPSLYVQAPIVRDSTPTAAGLPAFGPATLGLSGQGSTGVAAITVDPAWLANPARVYPVTVDVPVVTASQAGQNGVFCAVQSCAPNVPAQETRVLVGTVGGCTNHGILYFSVTQLLYLIYNHQITSATLHLYTPNNSGPSGILVYQNAPGATLPPAPAVPHPHPTSFPAPRPPATAPVTLPPPPAIQSGALPTWNSAPAIAPGTAGIAQSSSAGNWQGWDVTTAVNQWARNEQTNSGLTLEVPVGNAPVAVPSPLGAGDDTPDSAPYLDITLAPLSAPASGGAVAPGAVTPDTPCNPGSCQFNDGAYFPYGVNGGSQSTSSDMSLASSGLDTSFFRVPAQSYAVNGQMPCGDSSYSPTFWQPDYTQMQLIYAQHMIPLITFIQNPTCVNPGPYDSTDWYYGMQYFSYYMPNFGTVCIGPPGSQQKCTSNPPMYFEIGNEVDLPQNPTNNYSANWRTLYPTDFQSAAEGLQAWLSYPYVGHPVYTNYFILTAGAESPSDGQCGTDNNNYSYMMSALANAASNNIPFPVPPAHLGAAIHPYSYLTNEEEPFYWRNFEVFGRNIVCTNLDDAILHWRAGMDSLPGFGGVPTPLVMTEINAASSALCTAYQPLSEVTGAFQIDLFTWEYDHFGGSLSYGTPYPLRTIWFESRDNFANEDCNSPPTILGVFTGNNPPQTKQFNSPILVGPQGNQSYWYFTCPNYGYNTTWTTTLSSLFYLTEYGPCY